MTPPDREPPRPPPDPGGDADQGLAYATLDALRGTHYAMRRQHEEGELAPDDIEVFVDAGRRAGAFLRPESERFEAQRLLNYWATVLYQQRGEMPSTALDAYDPELAERLPEDLFDGLGQGSLTGFQDEVRRRSNRAGVVWEQGLFNALIASVRERPNPAPLAAAMLDALWERRDGNTLTWDAFEQVGSPVEALRRRADALLERTPSDERELLQRLVLRFVTLEPDPDGDARDDLDERLVPAVVRDEALGGIAPDPDAIEALLDELIRSHLVHRREDGRLVVSDPSLVGWIETRGWLDDEALQRIRISRAVELYRLYGRRFRLRQRALGEALRYRRRHDDLSQEERNLIDESLRARWQRVALVGFLGTAVVAALVGAALVIAVQQFRIAESRRLALVAESSSAPLRQGDPSRGDLAVAARSSLQAWRVQSTPEARSALAGVLTAARQFLTRSELRSANDSGEGGPGVDLPRLELLASLPPPADGLDLSAPGAAPALGFGADGTLALWGDRDGPPLGVWRLGDLARLDPEQAGPGVRPQAGIVNPSFAGAPFVVVDAGLLETSLGTLLSLTPPGDLAFPGGDRPRPIAAAIEPERGLLALAEADGWITLVAERRSELDPVSALGYAPIRATGGRDVRFGISRAAVAEDALGLVLTGTLRSNCPGADRFAPSQLLVLADPPTVPCRVEVVPLGVLDPNQLRRLILGTGGERAAWLWREQPPGGAPRTLLSVWRAEDDAVVTRDVPGATALAFDDEGTLIVASLGSDGPSLAWYPPPYALEAPVRRVALPGNEIDVVTALAANRDRLALLDTDNRLFVWRWSDGSTPPRRVHEAKGDPVAMRFDATGELLLLREVAGDLQVLDVGSNQPMLLADIPGDVGSLISDAAIDTGDGALDLVTVGLDWWLERLPLDLENALLPRACALGRGTVREIVLPGTAPRWVWDPRAWIARWLARVPSDLDPCPPALRPGREATVDGDAR